MGILKKSKKEMQVTHEIDYAKLEDVLAKVKSGEITISQGAQEVNTLYDATARFLALHHSTMALELSGRHIDMIDSIVKEQHDDFQELIKVIRDKKK